MGDRLRVDTAELRQTGEALRFLRSELAQAQQVADVGGILGHAGLADRLSSFASNWNDRRAEMMGTIQALSDAATTAGQTYEEIEQHLVTALTEGS